MTTIHKQKNCKDGHINTLRFALQSAPR